jgi:hypothetical protein
MSLTPSQTKLVQTSFYRLIEEITLAAQIFYERRFEKNDSGGVFDSVVSYHENIVGGLA